jgi:hypothetical protein
MQWKDGALEKAVIEAKYDGVCRLRTKTPVTLRGDNRKQRTSLEERPSKDAPHDYLLEFEAKAGDKFIVTAAL